MRKLPLVLFLFALSSSSWAANPEDVSSWSTGKSLVYKAYARALSYLPERIATGMQKKLALWAYDPAGRSAYGIVNQTIGRGTSTLGLSSVWDSSPYVNSPQGGCPEDNLGFDGIAGNQRCHHVDWTRGYQGSLGGSALCSVSDYYRYAGQVTGNTCGSLRMSCVTGGYGITWPETCVELTAGQYCTPLVGTGGYTANYWVISNCSPEISTNTETTWQKLPLPNDYLEDTAYIIETLNLASSSPAVTSTDYADFQGALARLESGVYIPTGNLPAGETANPSSVWDFNGSTIIGGGGGYADTYVTTVTIDTAGITDRLDNIYNIISSTPSLEVSTPAVLAPFESVFLHGPLADIAEQFQLEASTQPVFPCIEGNFMPNDKLPFKFCLEDYEWTDTLITFSANFLLFISSLAALWILAGRYGGK